MIFRLHLVRSYVDSDGNSSIMVNFDNVAFIKPYAVDTEAAMICFSADQFIVVEESIDDIEAMLLAGGTR